MQKVIIKGNESLHSKEERMKELIRNYPVSGQTAKQYCAANKIKEKTFYYWHRKYKNTDTSASSAPTILPLKINQINDHIEKQPLFAELRGIKIYQRVPAAYLLTLINH